MGQVLQRFSGRKRLAESPNTASFISSAMTEPRLIPAVSEESDWVAVTDNQPTAETMNASLSTDDADWESDWTTTLESRGSFSRSETTGKSGAISSGASSSSSSESRRSSCQSETESLEDESKPSLTGSFYFSDTSVDISSLPDLRYGDEDRIEARLLRQRWADVCWEVLVRDYAKHRRTRCEAPAKRNGLRTMPRPKTQSGTGRQWTLLYAIHAQKNTQPDRPANDVNSMGETTTDDSSESPSISSAESDYHSESCRSSSRC